MKSPVAFLVTWANGERALKLATTFGPHLRAGAISRGAVVTPLGAIDYVEPPSLPHRVEVGLADPYAFYRPQ
jgi:hypothetical protein